MPLVRGGRVVDDAYVRVADGAALPDGVAVILPAARFFAAAAKLAGRAPPIGVLWPNDRRVAELAPSLHRLALVALTFPNFRDGRAYSQARQLRERYGFRGELRATGQVLRDQFLFLLRAGFDSLEVSKAADAAAFAQAIGRYSAFYQPSADGRSAIARQRLLLRSVAAHSASLAPTCVAASTGSGQLAATHSGAGDASGLSFSTT